MSRLENGVEWINAVESLYTKNSIYNKAQTLWQSALITCLLHHGIYVDVRTVLLLDCVFMLI